ncbi:MAG: 3'(2'),5'-bisphosphate nucleotidase CysQ [Alphaproteobacteria bacterium]|nr:3'(2'),5'-bisphosphate nucleotidase CysQ [Alphaproteobacteria bacterium]
MNEPVFLETAILAAQEACRKILEIYGTDFEKTVSLKADESPLTLADIAANEVICARLSERFPDIPILSEESNGSVPLDARFCWIVDPLDGTKEFIKRNGEFTVNIALTENNSPVLGVIALPVTGTLYFASYGNGAFRLKDQETVRLSVSRRTENLVWVGSKSHSGEKEETLIKAHSEKIKETVSAGSSLKGTMVAEGIADVYYRFGLTYEWDTCAMHAIVEEAGGIFRRMDGSAMRYNRKNHLNEGGFYAVNRAENIWVPK